MFHICPACHLPFDDVPVGNYYGISCPCGCRVEVYHYGYDVFLEGREFHFDDSGYGNDRSRRDMDEFLKSRRAAVDSA